MGILNDLTVAVKDGQAIAQIVCPSTECHKPIIVGIDLDWPDDVVSVFGQTNTVDWYVAHEKCVKFHNHILKATGEKLIVLGATTT